MFVLQWGDSIHFLSFMLTAIMLWSLFCFGVDPTVIEKKLNPLVIHPYWPPKICLWHKTFSFRSSDAILEGRRNIKYIGNCTGFQIILVKSRASKFSKHSILRFILVGVGMLKTKPSHNLVSSHIVIHMFWIEGWYVSLLLMEPKLN